MKSIITENMEQCIICGSTKDIETHHAPFGGGRRMLADRFGLLFPLCAQHHRGTDGVHGRDGAELRHRIDRMAQEAFERTYPDESFLRVFGRNYK